MWFPQSAVQISAQQGQVQRTSLRPLLLPLLPPTARSGQLEHSPQTMLTIRRVRCNSHETAAAVIYIAQGVRQPRGPYSPSSCPPQRGARRPQRPQTARGADLLAAEAPKRRSANLAEAATGRAVLGYDDARLLEPAQLVDASVTGNRLPARSPIGRRATGGTAWRRSRRELYTQFPGLHRPSS